MSGSTMSAELTDALENYANLEQKVNALQRRYEQILTEMKNKQKEA